MRLQICLSGGRYSADKVRGRLATLVAQCRVAELLIDLRMKSRDRKQVLISHSSWSSVMAVPGYLYIRINTLLLQNDYSNGLKTSWHLTHRKPRVAALRRGSWPAPPGRIIRATTRLDCHSPRPTSS